jgi:SAM-dependent methyltransferase
MKDILGKYLLRLRIRAVLPQITGRLLDIGCGTNDLVKTYPGSGVGVDVYDWGGVDLVVEDTAHLPYKPQEFDTVTIIAALNHIPNREQVLKEAYRVLSANGKIILTMIPPFISAIWHTFRKPWDVDQKDRGMKQGEVYGLSHEQIHSLLRQAGFYVTYETRFMLGINLLVVASKVDAS